MNAILRDQLLIMNKIPSKISCSLRFQKCRKSSRFCSSFVPPIPQSSFLYCIDKVQQSDNENYLCTLLLPSDLQVTSFTLRAFNVEIASIADQVSEKITGEMRFQFWQDAIDQIYNKQVPSHPICIQLAEAIHAGNLSKMHLKRLISARRKNLVSPGFHSLEDAEEYYDSSNSPISMLLFEAAGVKNIDSDHAGSHLGKAQGLTNMLRSTIYYSRRRKVVLPQELLMKHNVAQEQILRHTVNTNMKDLTFEVATRIHQHLEHMKKLQKKLNRVSKHILLPRVCVETYLKNLRRADFDIFHPTLQKKVHNLAFKLWVNKLFS